MKNLTPEQKSYHKLRANELRGKYQDESFELPLHVIDEIQYHESFLN